MLIIYIDDKPLAILLLYRLFEPTQLDTVSTKQVLHNF